MVQITFFNIQLDLLEVVGAAIGLAYLFFEYRASIWTWVFGVLMPVVYVWLFFRNGLYANMGINVYYIAASVYGFVAWRRTMRQSAGVADSETDQLPSGGQVAIQSCPRRFFIPIVVITLLLAAALTFLLTQLKESQYPLLDGLTASLSMMMMYMLSRRWYQQWILCIVSEPLMMALGILTGMYATVVMYAIYLVVAVMGYIKWRRDYLLQTTGGKQ